MAYYFPQTYQQYGYPYQQNSYQQAAPQSFQQQGGQPQIQNSGFISVRSIEEAFNWPVAPGNSITFKDENSPYIYTKTKGFSQLEAPIFERFRLVKEDDTQQAVSTSTEKAPEPFEAKEQINSLWKEVDALKAQIDALKPKQKKAVRKEVAEDEQDSE